MKFESLSLAEPLLRGLKSAGYDAATPIQQQAIPQVLKGRDLVGCAQTGTGKTAAFALPTLQRLLSTAAAPTAKPTGADRRRQRAGRRPIRSLILAPTRELAGQICDSLATYGRFTGLRHAVIYGGVRQGPQVRALQSGIDILVATPGRLLDLTRQGYVKLGSVEVLILDEADQMLDMGFIHDLRKIVAHVPDERQTLMFSATMPKEVRQLASQWLRRPFQVQATPAASTPRRVSQAVYFVERNHKAATLTRFLRQTRRSKTLIFSRTKRGADKIARGLERDGIRALAIHGNKSQAQRQAVMRSFSSPRPPVLVATDLASRGLDFSDVSHVINYDMPDAPETYVHRIGRTARAGASGQAVSFCGRDERKQLRMIERLTGQAVSVKQLSATSDNPRSPATSSEPGHDGAGNSQAAAANTGRHDAKPHGTQRPSKGRPSSKPRRRVGKSKSPHASKPRGRVKATRQRRKATPRVASGL